MGFSTLPTERLIIREYALSDLDSRHQLMQQAFESREGLEDTRQWLTWTLANYRELAKLHQPPYGDYALALKTTGELIGSVGLVPSIIPWGVLPKYGEGGQLVSPEFGLFWAILPQFQGQGFATEAAGALITFIFDQLHARRVVATTEHANLASQRVMQNLGMRLERNPGSDPFWFEVVGILENPRI